MSNVSTANSIIATDKRRIEGDLRGMQQELDNLMNNIKNSEEKTKKALADAGKIFRKRWFFQKKRVLFVINLWKYSTSNNKNLDT